MDNKGEFVKHHHDYLNNYIKFADAKALGVITINGLVMKMVYGYLTNNMNDTKSFILLSGFVLLIIGIVLSVLVVFPRTTNKRVSGLIFWENVNCFEKSEYIDQINSISEQKLFNKMVEQNYYLAKTVTRKYSILRKAFLFSLLGYILLIVAGLFWITT